MAVQLGDRWFPYIESSNKKEGRKEAADVALRVLMAEGSYQLTDAALPVGCGAIVRRNAFPPYAIGLGHVRSFVTQVIW